MPTMLNPLDVADQLRHDLVDKPDPPLNYIAALDALIHYARGTDPTLSAFECRYSIAAREARRTAPIKHAVVHGRLLSTCFDFEYDHEGNADEPEQAANAFTKVTEGADLAPVEGVYEFLEAALHLAQQTGGRLTFRGREVRASHMDQTAGAGFCEITDDSTLLRDGVLMSLNDIMEGKK